MAAIAELGQRLQEGIQKAQRKFSPERRLVREPLFDHAYDLWEVADPDREPNIKRAAFFRFVTKPTDIKQKPEEIAFNRILASFATPEDAGSEGYLGSISVNPDFCNYPTRPPQDIESPVSFQLTIWSPPIESTNQREPILTVIERPAPNWLILSPDQRSIQTHGKYKYYNLTGADNESGELDWRRVYYDEVEEPYYPYLVRSQMMVGKDYKPNPEWQRRFIDINLQRLIDVTGRTGSVDDSYGIWLREEIRLAGRARFNRSIQRHRAEGEVEMGSIAMDIIKRDPVGLALL